MKYGAIRLTAADTLRIARNGIGVFILLMAAGGALTAAEFYRAQKSFRMTQPELVFQMDTRQSSVEERLYSEYFSNLEFSNISARSIHVGRNGRVYVSAGVPLKGVDDPRVRRVVAGLQAVSEKAAQELGKRRGTNAANIHLLQRFLELLPTRADSQSDDALRAFAHWRLLEFENAETKLQSRIAKAHPPVLIKISASKDTLNLVFGVIACLVATIVTALAGAFLVGYGRLILKHSDAE